MTAGQAVDRADGLRPNQYARSLKLGWLQRLDGQIRAELLLPLGIEAADTAGTEYADATALTVPFPYAEELYTAYLFAQIDLHNGEIAKYNQSTALLSAAWRQYADSLMRQSSPAPAPFRF